MVTTQIDSTEAGIRASEQRYRHLFQHVPICIFVADLTVVPAAIVEANRRAELVFGYTAAEMVGMPAAQLVPEETAPAILAIVQRVQQGQTVTAETINRHRDGTRFPVRVIATPDPTDPGRMIITVEDITAEKGRRSEAEAIDAERHRIAHEIHDGVAQTLAGLRFKSALWTHLADAAPPGMRAALDELQAVLNAAIVDLRRAIFALRPVDLEALGFFPALAQLVGDFGDQNQVVARLEVSGPQEALPAAYELPLFRVIQEGVNNIGQHARASSVLVRLAVDAAGGGSGLGVGQRLRLRPQPTQPDRSHRSFRFAPDARAHPGSGWHAGYSQRKRPGYGTGYYLASGRKRGQLCRGLGS